MKIPRSIVLTGLASCLFSFLVYAQTPRLTNADIVKLFDSGVSPQIIVAKINASPTKFDTSASALVKLKELGIPETVILAMVKARPYLLAEDTREPERSFTIADAVGSRQIFIDTTDKASEIEMG